MNLTQQILNTNLIKSVPSSTTIRQRARDKNPDEEDISEDDNQIVSSLVVSDKVRISQKPNSGEGTKSGVTHAAVKMNAAVKSSVSQQKTMSLQVVASERHSNESDDDDGMKDLFPKTTDMDTEEELHLTKFLQVSINRNPTREGGIFGFSKGSTPLIDRISDFSRLNNVYERLKKF